jgi:prefoldin subunit 5
MLIFVIAFNLLLALLNTYAAWHFWKLGRRMAQLSQQLERLERRSHRLLASATREILQEQQATGHLNQQYRQLRRQLQQLQQILLLLNLAMRLWQRCDKRLRQVKIGL